MPATDPSKISKVVVHPLVLLSVVDHFNRMGKVGNVKRTVGVLLGANRQGILDVSNSYAVPFDEDAHDKSVWFLDHDYLEQMYSMFKKVNGPKLCQNDVIVNDLMRKYCPNSVLVVIDAKPKDLGLPTEAYVMVEEVHDDGTPTTKTFDHVPSEIGAEEAEERITGQLMGLRGLQAQAEEINSYLQKVAAGTLPINHQIDVFNLLPDVNLQQFVKAVYVKTNDQMLVVYLASLIRSVIALHNLINNKIQNRDAERNEGKDMSKDKKEKKDEKDAKKDDKDTSKQSDKDKDKKDTKKK
ncbi:PSMD7-like protein [Mya arenaria]|uniref:PSMD7-like protein n=1 Tax=Mya arenaria TaxID=6604 RepID=A0ABY7ESU0_MYAAR|nr:PSMD7-like protein [Mya arenaria]